LTEPTEPAAAKPTTRSTINRGSRPPSKEQATARSSAIDRFLP
jgi:hypothetical protein